MVALQVLRLILFIEILIKYSPLKVYRENTPLRAAVDDEVSFFVLR